MSLQRSFKIPADIPTSDCGTVEKKRFEDAGGIFSHFHVDHKGQGKWDVAPWWDRIVDRVNAES